MGVSDVEELHQPFTRTRHELTGKVFQSPTLRTFYAEIWRECVDPRFGPPGRVLFERNCFVTRQEAKDWVESFLL